MEFILLATEFSNSATADTTPPTTAMFTTGEILQQTNAFLTEALSQPDLRRRIYSTLRNKLSPSVQLNIKHLNLAAETLENAITTTNSSVKSSSLRLSEKVLLSYSENPFSSFLLSLIYTLCQCPIDASLSLLDCFRTDPSTARSEVAPQVFEEMFLINFLPVLEWYNEQRSRILSSLSSSSAYDSDDNSIVTDSVVSCTTLLSKMNGNQASELKELERDYEQVLDENCRVFAGYFEKILGNRDGNRVIDPPLVVLEAVHMGDTYEHNQNEKSISTEFGSKNGRYNPIWTEGEQSIEIQINKAKTLSKFPSFLPERVSPRVLTNQRSSSRTSKPSPYKDSGSEPESVHDDDSCSTSSSDSDAEVKEKKTEMALVDSKNNQSQKQKQPILIESSCWGLHRNNLSTFEVEVSSLDPLMEDYDNQMNEGRHTPPKDFVCPITTHIFNDPVTLETGQTYERKAIQQWLERGNATCPITRQKLHSTQLPKTNYVLKRLIASWKELSPRNSGLSPEISYLENEHVYIPQLTSPNSVISQATIDGTVNELRLTITSLCTSEVLKEAETAVLRIERFWQETSMEVEIQTMLSQPPVINGFVEILFSSIDTRVLIATVFLLSELGSRDSSVISTLTRVDSDVECVVALFKKGLFEAVVLIYLLRPSIASLLQMDMADSLLSVINKREDEFFKMCIKPKAASVLLLGQIVASGDDDAIFEVIRRVISGKVIECIINSLESEWTEERITAICILLRCMQEDGKCRNIVADKAELAPVLESFVGSNDKDRFEIVQFLSELVKLNRRTFNNQILHIIKDEGSFSTMHTLLIYLQTAAADQLPVVAGLLLQLDLLAEPRKMSIYREEAIDTLISCLKNSDSPSAQIAAAETILSLQGRFSSSGKPLVQAYLLKHAGLDKTYRSTMRREQLSAISGEVQETMEEEKAAEEWERKMAFVLVSHEFGLIFEALSEGLKSRYAEIYSACFVSATWLVHMLRILPDMGIQGAARICLLNRFVSIFKSAKDTEDKALSMLALSSFIHDPVITSNLCWISDGLRDITTHMKEILKGLREFKKLSNVAFEMLKVFSEGSESSADLWNHKELTQQDCSMNGEVLSIVCYKDKVFSGHSDGTIKVWTSRASVLYLIQEIREHSKAVTSLTVLQSGDTLYSGSHDKTVRAWSIKETLQCEQVYDVKDHVNNLLVANSISCFIPQGAGIKIHSWSGTSKLLNPSKYVKCLALVQGRLYSGCQDNSIQEIDLATGTLISIQNGSRKLLAKANPVHALKVHDGLIYSVGSSLEGTALKIWNASNYTLNQSVSLGSEVRTMVISSDMIYMGCKGGVVEVWCRKKLTRKETLQTGTNCKVVCMALDSKEDVLVIGTSDGRVQAWGVS
ncbi:putative E3 ubiquitin-protein ligase LIN [Cynara cardunculus var. scolymus]|uniref:putative E3 ubiquitin-protein ligase LIN n=1 Tax=Cynara cardunculus var. scolymus TaxID=59895 RepID=UPI000D6298C3|nr:putative E3 ubiquitin-protein ligase LIN [Cynara cardunculus var. scolymus]